MFFPFFILLGFIYWTLIRKQRPEGRKPSAEDFGRFWRSQWLLRQWSPFFDRFRQSQAPSSNVQKKLIRFLDHRRVLFSLNLVFTTSLSWEPGAVFDLELSENHWEDEWADSSQLTAGFDRWLRSWMKDEPIMHKTSLITSFLTLVRISVSEIKQRR